MQTLKKPEPVTRYDYHEVMKYLQEKYHFHNDRDYYNLWDARGKLHERCRRKVEKTLGSFSFYSKSPLIYTEEENKQHDLFNQLKDDGEKALPKDLDFWSDVILEDQEITDGSTFTVYEVSIKRIEVEEYKNIIRWMMDEFGDGPVGRRFVNLEVNW